MRVLLVLVGLLVTGSALGVPAGARSKPRKKSPSACLDKCRKQYDQCIAKAANDGGAARACVRMADECEVKCDK